MALVVKVNAQTQHTIPVRWQLVPGQVKIMVPALPRWAHDAVVDAMVTWNEGQLWFKQKYFNTGEVYTFTESASGVEVRFVYRDQNTTGTVLETPRGRVISLRLTDSNNNTISSVALASCAAHELGHILGLGHTSVKVDLMGGFVIPGAPSTLDLYAVHLLAGGLKDRVIVTLPSNIPFVPLPEYADTTRITTKTTRIVYSTTQSLNAETRKDNYISYVLVASIVVTLVLVSVLIFRRHKNFRS